MLTDKAIRATKPSSKILKLADHSGLRLEISPSDTRSWRFRYRWEGKEQTLTLGQFPDVSLAEAREKASEARAKLRRGENPRQVAVAASLDASFGAVAERWLARSQEAWTAGHARTVRSRLTRDLLPWLATRPIAEITAPDVLAVLRRIEQRGAHETAHRIRQIVGQVFDFAIAEGLASSNPTLSLQRALKPPKEEHLAAIVEPEPVGRLMQAIEGYKGGLIVRTALRLAPLVFVRPGELRAAEWAEFDLDTATWAIPAKRMKGGDPLVVPLSTQAVALLREVHAVTGRGVYVFPTPRSPARPLSNNAILAALRTLGYEKGEMTGHGFRAMARTLLDEQLKFRPDIIEQQLGHVQRDPNGRAYNRTKHLDERRAMMQRWADYLDELREQAATRAAASTKGARP